jgi:hypothetical protein
MSAPPLPEVFGNYALGEFSEVVAPGAISWWPQTAGWWLVAAALAVWCARRLWRRAKHWYRNRYRREALQRLQPLNNRPDFVAQVNRLLKLAAMAAYSRTQVAALSGEEWSHFLNAQCPQAVFDTHQAALLAGAQYRELAVDEAAAAQLKAAAQRWLREHRGELQRA